MIRTYLAGLLLLLSSTSALPALGAEPEWGHLSGRFLYDGDPPPASSLDVPESHLRPLGLKEVPDESLVVGKEGGLANVFIWLRPAIGVKPAIHPSYETSEESTVELIARDLRLRPRAFVMRTSQTLAFRHEDTRTAYNLKFDTIGNAPYCGLMPAGQTTTLSFERPERIPINVSCNIHPWISSRLLVLDHPYAAVTDQEGRFEIRNLPVGTWDFVSLHERSGYIKQPMIDGRQLEWKRGTFEYTIKPGDNTLGEVLVAPEAFRPKDRQ